MSLPFRKNIVVVFHNMSSSRGLEKTLKILARYYEIIPITEVKRFFHDEYQELRSACALSFDDGDRTFYDTAFPVLKKMNLPASVFVSPKKIIERKNFWFQEVADYDDRKLKKFISEFVKIPLENLVDFPRNIILKCLRIQDIEEIISVYKKRERIHDKRPELMDPGELVEVHASGLVTVGAHTQNHPVLSNESDDISRREINDSVNDLSDLLGTEVKFFAYPNGSRVLDYTERELIYLDELNIPLTLSTNPGNFKKSDDPLEVPRIGLTHGSSFAVYAKIILGSYWDKLKFGRTQENARKKIYGLLKQTGYYS